MLALVAVVPMLVAARDPRGDVVSCGAGTAVPGATADVVAVDGQAAELGTAAVWRITFARPIAVPDRAGAPLRIDVLVRDPLIAPVTRGDERGMNRIVRWNDTGADATEEVTADDGTASLEGDMIDGEPVQP